MGFEIPETVTLEFSGAFAGLEITCSLGLPIAEQLAIRRALRDVDTDAEDGFLKVFTEWCNRVKPEWNVTKDGEPVPCTAENIIDRLPGDVLILILPKWREAMGVSGPLETVSSSGDSVTSIPALANLSKSLSS